MDGSEHNAWPASEVAGIAGFVGGVVATWLATGNLVLALVAGATLGALGSALRQRASALVFAGVLGFGITVMLVALWHSPLMPGVAVGDHAPEGFRPERFRFFESGAQHPALDRRVYERSFDAQHTRYVCWQLDASFVPPTERTPVRIMYRYLRPDGSLLGAAQHTAHLEAGWTKSWHSRCWGWDAPGKWVPGQYRVTLTLAGEDLIKGSFAIY